MGVGDIVVAFADGLGAGLMDDTRSEGVMVLFPSAAEQFAKIGRKNSSSLQPFPWFPPGALVQSQAKLSDISLMPSVQLTNSQLLQVVPLNDTVHPTSVEE